MTFTWFRKHEKLFLWITVGFTIVIFALFSSMGDVDRVFSSGPKSESIAGSFTVATTGEQRDVHQEEFLVVKRGYSRLAKMMGGSSNDITDQDVWAFLITTADAMGSGLKVSDQEMGQGLSQMFGGDKAFYKRVVLGGGFPTLHRFEEFYRSVLINQRWRGAQMVAGSVLSAEDVYQRWRVDHELFDLDVLTFKDRDPSSLPEPSDAVLLEWYEGLPDFQRNSMFVEPARHDIAFAFVPLDANVDELMVGLGEDVTGKVSEPTDAQLQQRFQRVKAQRYQDVDQPDEPTLALLRGELMALSLAANGQVAFRAQSEEDRSVESFQAIMEAHGLTFEDPEGLLNSEEVEALDPIGDSILPLRLAQMRSPGDSQTLTSVTGEETAAAVVYLQALIEERPLSYDEARDGDEDLVLVEWRKSQADQAARDFREALREASAALPEVKAVTEPLEALAVQDADAAIAEAVAAADAGPGAPVVDEALEEQIRVDQLAAVQQEIDATIMAHENLVWDAGVDLLGENAEVVHYASVPRDYRATLTADERDPESTEQFVKSHFSIYQLGEENITEVLRMPSAQMSFVVLVTKRRFPDMAAMFADPEGMLESRRRQASEVMLGMQDDFLPETIMLSHNLKLLRPLETDEELWQAEVGDELESEEPARL
ncbi:MAG: hypothetical protein P8N09_01695 [Planctomycetota bacterium]|nr:hypothetical protein [Planctomycetota bacterium]